MKKRDKKNLKKVLFIFLFILVILILSFIGFILSQILTGGVIDWMLDLYIFGMVAAIIMALFPITALIVNSFDKLAKMWNI